MANTNSSRIRINVGSIQIDCLLLLDESYSISETQTDDHRIKRLLDTDFYLVENLFWICLAKKYENHPFLGFDPYECCSVTIKDRVLCWIDLKDEDAKPSHAVNPDLNSLLDWLSATFLDERDDLISLDQQTRMNKLVNQSCSGAGLQSLFAQSFLLNTVSGYNAKPKLDSECLNTKPVKSGWMYMAQLDGCIKIGYSNDPENRVQSFSTSNMSAKMLHKKKATIQDEKAFHKLHNNGKEQYDNSRLTELVNLFN